MQIVTNLDVVFKVFQIYYIDVSLDFTAFNANFYLIERFSDYLFSIVSDCIPLVFFTGLQNIIVIKEA